MQQFRQGKNQATARSTGSAGASGSGEGSATRAPAVSSKPLPTSAAVNRAEPQTGAISRVVAPNHQGPRGAAGETAGATATQEVQPRLGLRQRLRSLRQRVALRKSLLRTDTPTPSYRIREILERDRALVAANGAQAERDAMLRNLARARRTAFGTSSARTDSQDPSARAPIFAEVQREAQIQVRRRAQTPTEGWVLEAQPQFAAPVMSECDALLTTGCGVSAAAPEAGQIPIAEDDSIPWLELEPEDVLEEVEVPPPVVSGRAEPTVSVTVPVPSPAGPAATQALTVDEDDDDEPGEDLQVPIRTRTMARLLASQGKRQQALAIYAELLARNPSDLKLRQEAERVASEPPPSAACS